MSLFLGAHFKYGGEQILDFPALGQMQERAECRISRWNTPSQESGAQFGAIARRHPGEAAR